MDREGLVQREPAPALLRREQTRLHGYLHSLVRDLNDADDLFQQTTMILWKKFGEFDAQGVAVTLLHYAQVNPVSVPFWSRMGYRPLWTAWDIRPAAALR